jgi:hypothetical protein
MQNTAEQTGMRKLQYNKQKGRRNAGRSNSDWRKIWLRNNDRPNDVFRNVIISLNFSTRRNFLRRLFETLSSPTLATASNNAARQATHCLRSPDVTLFTGDKLRTAKILCTTLTEYPSSKTNSKFLSEINPYFLPSLRIPRHKYCDTLNVRHQIRACISAYYRLLQWINFQVQVYMYPLM